MREVRQSTAGATSSEPMRLYCRSCAFLSGCPSSPPMAGHLCGRPFRRHCRTSRMIAGILLQAKGPNSDKIEPGPFAHTVRVAI